MKRMLMMLIGLLPMCGLLAEETIQIVPFQATAGTTYKASDRKGFAINMNNGAVRPKALEFEFILPEGMAVATNSAGTVFRMSSLLEERFSVFDEEEEEYVSYYTPSCSLTDGVYKMLIVYGLDAPDDCAINGTSGEIITIYYTTTADMANGVYPIFVQNAKVSYEDGSKGYLPNSSSYVTIGDSSPLQTEANVDLSTLTGYMPSFVVEKMNEELAQNEQLVSVNLSGVTELGAMPAVPENAAWFTSSEAGLQRTFTEGYWSTVCLPFSLNGEQVEELKAAGVEIEAMNDYDEAANELSFAAADIVEADKPYIVRCQAGATTPFCHFQAVTADASLTAIPATSGKVTMSGTFEKLTLDSDEAVNYFVFNAADGEFVRVGKNATVPPFRAYIALGSAAASSRMAVRHHDGTTTGIASAATARPTARGAYDLLGRPVTANQARGNSITISNGRKMIAK